MAIQGMRHTENFVDNQRPENWRQGILLMYPNSSEIAKAPLLALTNLMRSESTDDPVFHWWEKALDDRRLMLDDGATGTGGTLDIDDSYKSAVIVKAGDILMVEQTGEIVRVASDPAASDELTVTRGVAGTSAASITVGAAGVNPFLQVIGSAFEEGSLAPTGVNYDPVEESNYTQIFRSTLEITRTASKTRLRTGDQVKEAKREALEYISIDIERAFWFGRKHATVVNGRPMRFTGGLKQQIISRAPMNVLPAPSGGSIDIEWLDTMLEPVFRFGASEKMMFTSNVVLTAIHKAIKGYADYTWEQGQKEYGMTINRLIGPFGTLVLKTHPLFNQMRGGITDDEPFTSEANNAYILDMGNIRYRHLPGDDLRYEPDLTPVGLDGMKSGYIAEIGLELHHAETHFVLTGIMNGVAPS